MPDIGGTAASPRSRTFGGGHPSRHDLAAEPSDTNRLNRAGFDELPQRRFRDAHVPPEADETNTPLSDQAARETLSRGKKFGRLGDSQQPLSTLAAHAARLAWPRSRRRRRAAPLARPPPGSAFGTPARHGAAASTPWLARATSSPPQSA